MTGTKWTWAALLVAASVALIGATQAPPHEREQPSAMKIALEEGRSPDGRLMALRVKAEGGGLGTCGKAEGAKFTKVREAIATKTLPVRFEIEGLDCEVVVSWGERGPWTIQVRSGKANAEQPAGTPADVREPISEAAGSDRS